MKPNHALCLSLLLMLLNISARADVRISFLRDESALQDTLALFDAAGISASAQSHFLARVHAYNAGPLLFYYKTPISNGFYYFENIGKAVAEPFCYHCEVHPPGDGECGLDNMLLGKFWPYPCPHAVDCFATVRLLVETNLANLRCTVVVLQRDGTPVHWTLVFERGTTSTLIEKMGSRGPFIRVDVEAPDNFSPWFRKETSSEELTQRVRIFYTAPPAPGNGDLKP